MEETLVLQLALQRILRVTYASSMKFLRALEREDAESTRSKLLSLREYVQKKRAESKKLVDSIEERGQKREKAEKNELFLRIVEFLGKKGLYQTAKALSEEMGLEDLTDTEAYRSIRDARESIEREEIERGIGMLEQMKSEGVKRALYGRKFIELCSKGRKQEAIDVSMKNSVEPSLLPLLVLPPDSPLFRNISESHSYQKLSSLLMSHISASLTGGGSSLMKHVKYGLIGFKSSECRRNSVPECPACRESLLSLTKTLPRSTHPNTRLICQATGSVISDRNPPMALPNGYVYSKKYMDRFPGGIVICQKTGAAFPKTVRLCYFV
jgi:macrophage erythroblast attacher